MKAFLRRFSQLPEQHIRTAAIQLCKKGLLTCTHGQPGDDDATYAVAWLPLDNPEQYAAEIQERHRRNMEKFS